MSQIASAAVWWLRRLSKWEAITIHQTSAIETANTLSCRGASASQGFWCIDSTVHMEMAVDAGCARGNLDLLAGFDSQHGVHASADTVDVHIHGGPCHGGALI